MKKVFTVYSLAIGLSLNLVFVISFYWMLIVCGEPRVMLDANSIGEYWIEFFLLQITLILLCTTFIIEAKNYFKEIGRRGD